MQCNVEFGYQLSICSRARETAENLDRVGWSQKIPNPKLTSSQQSGIKYAKLNASPYLAVALFEKDYIFVLQRFLCAYFG
jgi:hypothetical protein